MALDYIPPPVSKIDNIQWIDNIGFSRYNPEIFTLIIKVTDPEIDSNGLLEELQKVGISLNKECYLKLSGHSFIITQDGIKYNRWKWWESWNISVSALLITKTVHITKITPCNEWLKLQVLGKYALLSRYDLCNIFISLRSNSNYDRDEYGSNQKHNINLIVEKKLLK